MILDTAHFQHIEKISLQKEKTEFPVYFAKRRDNFRKFRNLMIKGMLIFVYILF